jgi:tetratricopeptide (TPR) repeat protein
VRSPSRNHLIGVIVLGSLVSLPIPAATSPLSQAEPQTPATPVAPRRFRVIVIPMPGSAPAPAPEPSPPSPVARPLAAPPEVATPTVSPAIGRLVDRYAAGESVFAQAFPSEAAFLAVRQPLFDAARAWRERWNPAGVTFLLDLSMYGLAREWTDGFMLLRTAEEMVTGRPIAPGHGLDALEINFHRAAIATLIGLRALGEAADYFARLDARIHRLSIPASAVTATVASTDGHLLLLRGLLDEASTAPRVSWMGTSMDALLPDPNDHVARQQLERAVVSFERVAADPAVAAEARVRRAFALHRLGRHAQALDALRTASALAADPSVRYWNQLLQGRVLDALGRTEDARAAYEGAGAMQPGAQTPRVALASLLQRAGQLTEARRWASAARSPEGAATFDPWWQYWLGELRWVPEWMAAMRKETP